LEQIALSGKLDHENGRQMVSRIFVTS